MQYYKVGFNTTDQQVKDVLIALLSEKGYEGFEETETSLFAFIDEGHFDKQEIAEIAVQFHLEFVKELIPQQNWNLSWEQNFQPVIVDGFCTVRADFHTIDTRTPYEIIITPKMSFGTGHHATTQLMINGMQHIDFTGKSVFDFGTGTGILAILAEKLGAKTVVAIDNDEWSYENVMENLKRNDSRNIHTQKGSIEDMVEGQYDIILANINRHILLKYMREMYDRLSDNGKILMSGILSEDVKMIQEAATSVGFRYVRQNELNNWVLLGFER